MASALGDFLRNVAVEYETNWPSPLSPTLRSAMSRSVLSLSIALVGFVAAPILRDLPGHAFFWAWEQEYIQILDTYTLFLPELTAFSLSALAVSLIVWFTTEHLEQGVIFWHRMSFCVVVAGSFSIMLFVVMIAIFLINLVIWLVCFVVIGAVLALLFAVNEATRHD